MSDLQRRLMERIVIWVKTQKTPVPKQELLREMELEGIGVFTTINVIDTLVKKGYIRKTHSFSRKVYYVQLRTF